ncbi:hypothetical protein BRM22_14890 [Xanthomonas oryzae pv. oryzae]|uniref:Uncharacterized protein n=2 Tax=Xanthomonas oryzae pv. oryzae TaxID=64187 RepID=A0A854CK39_XANOO|nr:hypothetical protein PXO_01868 [Xanthomonas oryzae pv. oryzae PXO99A]AJQ85436.1 hypothetical protein AZ54_07155 [Xanthomonas oryzae pv. oryzae PXO86]ALZ71237.1 hypothetical protein APZ20_06710 [Xanthomonas oryzae pv. oryzae]AOS03379.1 hypothetical protein ATY42_16235 [Xanthomonas oryzae pv. oryzae]AOS06761.1 hypothetical protein ATY43_12575 [Xanthomonas oryzae pv. oryzae]
MNHRIRTVLSAEQILYRRIRTRAVANLRLVRNRCVGVTRVHPSATVIEYSGLEQADASVYLP